MMRLPITTASACAAIAANRSTGRPGSIDVSGGRVRGYVRDDGGRAMPTITSAGEAAQGELYG